MDTCELERELRRNQDTLSSVGVGILAFGVWSIIKAVVVFVMQVPEQVEAAVEKQYVPATIALTGVFLLLIFALIIALRVFIWRSARAEGQGGRHKRSYLFAVGLLAVVSLFSLTGMILRMVVPGELETSGSGDGLTAAFIELTSLITQIQMIAASIRVKRITKELESRQG